MTPARYVQCLEILRWPNETLAEALGCDESLTEAYAVGLAEVPMKLGVWLEVAAQTHAALETEKPTGLKEKRFTERDL